MRDSLMSARRCKRQTKRKYTHLNLVNMAEQVTQEWKTTLGWDQMSSRNWHAPSRQSVAGTRKTDSPESLKQPTEPWTHISVDATQYDVIWRPTIPVVSVILEVLSLQPCHRQERLQWTPQRQHWRHRQWRDILYTDESCFYISHTDDRVSIWRRRGERYAENCVMEKDPWGGPSIVIWGGIWINRLVVYRNNGPSSGNGVRALRDIGQVPRPFSIPYFTRRQNHFFRQDKLPWSR